MRIPTTGRLSIDIIIAFGLFLAGVYIALKKENRWGWFIVVVALYWAYSMIGPIFR